jgi:hypothetical protein
MGASCRGCLSEQFGRVRFFGVGESLPAVSVTVNGCYDEVGSVQDAPFFIGLGPSSHDGPTNGYAAGQSGQPK